MKKIILSICLGIIFSGEIFSSVPEGKFRIEGTIDPSFDGQLAILSLKNDYQTVIALDTSVIARGRFSFEGEEFLPNLSSLRIENKKGVQTRPELDLLLESGTISVSFSADKPYLAGTALNDAFREYQDSMTYFQAQIAKIEPEWGNEVIIFPGTKLEKLYYLQGEYMMNFTERNFTNPLGKALLMRNLEAGLIPTGLYISTSKKGVDELFAFVDGTTRKHPRFISYRKMMEKAKAASSMISDLKIENFSFSTPGGKTQSLAGFIGKKEYVFLELWASWCGSCLASVPKLKEIYDTYADRLEIVSISLDTDRTSWLQALKTQQMPWPQLRDPKGFDGEMPKALGVENIPFGLLVDKKGMVIAKIHMPLVLKSFFVQSTSK